MIIGSGEYLYRDNYLKLRWFSDGSDRLHALFAATCDGRGCAMKLGFSLDGEKVSLRAQARDLHGEKTEITFLRNPGFHSWEGQGRHDKPT